MFVFITKIENLFGWTNVTESYIKLRRFIIWQEILLFAEYEVYNAGDVLLSAQLSGVLPAAKYSTPFPSLPRSLRVCVCFKHFQHIIMFIFKEQYENWSNKLELHQFKHNLKNHHVTQSITYQNTCFRLGNYLMLSCTII